MTTIDELKNALEEAEWESKAIAERLREAGRKERDINAQLAAALCPGPAGTRVELYHPFAGARFAYVVGGVPGYWSGSYLIRVALEKKNGERGVKTADLSPDQIEGPAPKEGA